MRWRTVASLALLGSLLLGSCSGGGGAALGSTPTDGPTTTAATTTSTTTPPAPEQGRFYLQTAVLATIEPEAEGFLLTLAGTQRRTSWLGPAESGVITTADLAAQWSRLGLDDEAPQAAVVPADPAEPAVLLTLAAPRWDDDTRTLRYSATVPDDADPQLAGMVPAPPADPAGTRGVVSVFIHQPRPERPPEPSPTTTTTTAPPDSTTTSLVADTTSSSTPTGAIPPSSLVPPPNPPSTPSQPPPTPAPPPTDGQPLIVASTNALVVPSDGTRRTFTLRNIGTGVGSWATTATYETGIIVAPTSGLLLPGSTTTIQVSYDGSHETNDFTDSLVIVTNAGSITIRLDVRGL